MKGVSRLDFTDLSRQGGHTAKFVHNEILDYLKYQEYGNDPAQTAAQDTKTRFDGGSQYLYSYSYWWPSALPVNSARCIFVSSEWLPRDFILDFFGGYQDADAGALVTMAIVKDLGPTYNYALLRYEVALDKANIKFAQLDDKDYTWWMYQTLTGGMFVEFPFAKPAQQGVPRTILMRRNGKVFSAIHKYTGEYLRTGASRDNSIINDGNGVDRLLINMTRTNRRAYLKFFHIGLTEYSEYDEMQEAQVTVTTTGDVCNAASPKAAITTKDEIGFILLAPGEEINIDMTSGMFDASCFVLEVSGSCTDTTPLSVSFNSANIGLVYTDKILLGDTTFLRDAGDKVKSSWTYTLKHVFYPELSYLFGYGFDKTTGFKRITMKNENVAGDIWVHFVRVVGEPSNGGVYTAGGGNLLEYMHHIDPNAAKLGEPGTVQHLEWVNTSGFTLATVHMTLEEDGSPLDGLIEYSADEITWYSSANPPGGLGLLLGSSVADDQICYFHVRTNLPETDPQLSSFISRFRFRLQT